LQSQCGALAPVAMERNKKGKSQLYQYCIRRSPSFVLKLTFISKSHQNICITASQSIIVGGNSPGFIVENNGKINVVAGHNIHIQHNTTVNSGCYLHGFIDNACYPCGSLINPSIPSVPMKEALLENITSNSPREYGLSLYPNPTFGKFTIELKHEVEINNQPIVRIFGVMRNEIYTDLINISGKTEISLESQPNGIYIVGVIIGDRIETMKIVKH